MSEQKPWTVVYAGHDLDLTTEQYKELKRLSFDDPPAAERMALELLSEARASVAAIHA